MRIVQITDTHIQAPGRLWKDRVDMAARLEAALPRVNALAADLVVHTGDVVDGGDDDAYRVAAGLLERLEAPLLALPGNHDSRDAMRRLLPGATSGGDFIEFAQERDGLTVLGLDTVEEHRTAGRFCAGRADRLRGRLAETSGPALVFQHHPPCPMALPHMDRFVFQGEDLYAVAIAEAPPLRIACGHVHAAAERHFHGALVAACPAIGVQIPAVEDGSGVFGFVVGGAAVRVFDWDAATGLTVKTVPLDAADGPHPFETDPNADFDATPRA
ncbi:MAG: metallophosphoesterase [Pseudomonadota bacterium]